MRGLLLALMVASTWLCGCQEAQTELEGEGLQEIEEFNFGPSPGD